ncbi:selenide, water dikinase SelD [Oscillibacter sp.]|uniref:selenide, water dikinase SelD n=1 Tax=Oscillibacter sp. TaxID=1945593 RepID=UPI00261DBD4D|nr:selenide, water dikinase SelD [Oscillibacter sp.]MDD3346589.1 selenide, water dikinase SelD [Oscillibacter sp.]
MASEIRLTRLAECAGCGAKVGAGVLAQLLEGLPTHTDPRLLVGYDKSDDASVYQISEELALCQTVDFFPPIVDDPFQFGQIAAANALSDVYAMGGEPKLALNLLCVSPEMDDAAVRAVLRGGYDKVYEAGAIITGGHSIRDREPKYGLAVTGFVHPAKVLRNDRARVGDVLILTKPLGVGVAVTAAKAGLADEALVRQVTAQMAFLNKAARDVMVRFPVGSCTDVTGFGFLGHALEMARGGEAAVVVESAKIPLLPGVLALAEMGLLPEGMYRNRRFAEGHTHVADGVSLAMQDLLYDPQTSGGLLMAVSEKDAPALLRALRDELPCAEAVGYVVEKRDGAYLMVT